MFALFWRTIKDRRTLLLIYILASIAILWMYVALFPSFKDQSAALEQTIKSFPESFMKAMNFDIKNFVTIEGYISTEQFSFMWPILAITFIVGFGGFALAGEIEKGTIELLLAQPISRAKIYFGRFLAGLVMILVFAAASILATPALATLHGISYNIEHFLIMLGLASMFSLSIYGLSFLFSAIFSDKGKVFFLSAAILVVMYVLNILAAIKDSISDLKYFSFFYYFNPAKALIYGQIDHWAYVVFLSVFVVSVIAGLIIFNRRDIAA